MLSFRALFLLLLTVLLIGCQSMSESECKVADWGRTGFDDGARGEPERRLADYTQDCGKIGIRPNATAYRQGWDAGIQRFCTAANGWREGVAGNEYKEKVCIGQPGFNVFSRYLSDGMQVYRTNEQINSNIREINRLQKKLESKISDDEKKQIRRQLQDIDRDQDHLRRRLDQQRRMAP